MKAICVRAADYPQQAASGRNKLDALTDKAKKLGAKGFVNSRDSVDFQRQAGKFDFIIDTVSAPHDLNLFLGLLKRDGTMVVVGVPQEPASVEAFSLIGGRRRLAGSLIGGIRETQEML
ncbi:MAG: NAD(P)-dependent alcohol dehydrogenase, partial [Acidobacteria bacterium]|nr:NAD(P)-dependent alcohol dehydrogenase [Acidobacteriota bacterium]